jgi:hypothetical protein
MEIGVELNAGTSKFKLDLNELGCVEVWRTEVVHVRDKKTVLEFGYMEPLGSDTGVLFSHNYPTREHPLQYDLLLVSQNLRKFFSKH